MQPSHLPKPASNLLANLTPDSANEFESLYNDVWDLVASDYEDPSCNGQSWSRWKNRFKGKLKTIGDANVAISTMLASLNDDYTRFLPPNEMSEQTLSIDSKLYGVGIQIALKDKKLVIVTPIEGTPAALAKLMPNDEIIGINSQQTSGMSIEDAASHIRGKAGTLVTLTILRGTKHFPVTLPRAEIKIKSVFTKSLNKHPEIGYIRLNSFISETTTPEMHQALEKLADKKALIVDLRGNYGGLLNNAVDIADMFLNQGRIVSIVNRQGEHRVFQANPGVLANQPMVVLIDGLSASASEILSGALQDNHRATLVGTQSFGKGLVQKITPLQDGAGLNITIAKYLTPNGTDINKKGIRPNVWVSLTEQDFRQHNDRQLDKAIQLLASAVKH